MSDEALRPRAGTAGPVFALLLCAFVGGTGWWPFRALQAHGLHPLWTLAIVYALAVPVVVWRQPASVAELARAPGLWGLALAFGAMNAAFFWGVSVGDVVRVVLLFYVMPLWTALLAWLLLAERPDRRVLLALGLALAGAWTVLWPSPSSGSGGVFLPLPRSLADALGLLGGFAFALNNVLLRRQSRRSPAAQVLAMFLGGALVAGLTAAGLMRVGRIEAWPAPGLAWIAMVTLLALWFLAGNHALQFGATRLSPNITGIVLLAEVLFATLSSWALGAGTVTPAAAIGGLLILSAALVALR